MIAQGGPEKKLNVISVPVTITLFNFCLLWATTQQGCRLYNLFSMQIVNGIALTRYAHLRRILSDSCVIERYRGLIFQRYFIFIIVELFLMAAFKGNVLPYFHLLKFTVL